MCDISPQKIWTATNSRKESTFNHAIEKIEQAGANVVQPIHLVTVSQLAQKEGGADFDVIACEYFEASTLTMDGEPRNI